MMIKKQLGVLAGSIAAATGAQAISLASGDALAVFNTAGQGSFYQFIPGSNAGTLLGGNGFSVDASAAAAALGGTIESFALIAFADAGNPVYNYTEFLYVDIGGGMVVAGNSAASTSNTALGNIQFNIQAFLDNAVLGANGEGSLGDFDGNANVAGFLNFGPSQLVASLFTLGGATNTAFVPVTNPSAAQDGVYLDGTTFAATATGGTVIPVPAAAWLFGSALLGLGVVRRK